MQLDGIGGAADAGVGHSKVRAADERLQVVGAELRLSFLEGRLVQFDGIVGAAGGLIRVGQVDTAASVLGWSGPKLDSHQLEGHLVQLDGLVVAAGGLDRPRRGYCGWSAYRDGRGRASTPVA